MKIVSNYNLLNLNSNFNNLGLKYIYTHKLIYNNKYNKDTLILQCYLIKSIVKVFKQYITYL